MCAGSVALSTVIVMFGRRRSTHENAHDRQPVVPDEAALARVERTLLALVDHMGVELPTDEETYERICFDMHAILMGWHTTHASLDETSRAMLRLSLGMVTPNQLTALLGPPRVAPGRNP